MRPIRVLALLSLLAGCSGESSHDGAVPEGLQQAAIAFTGNMPESQQVVRGVGQQDMRSVGQQDMRGSGQQATRSVSLHDKGVSTFKVWGYKNDAFDESTGSYTSYQTVMPAFTVNWIDNSAYTTTSNTSGWEYVDQTSEQTVKFWDWSAKAYRFFAVTNGAGSTPSWSYAATDEAGTLTLTGLNALSESSAPYFSKLWFGREDAYGKAVRLEFLKPFSRVRFMFNFAEGLGYTYANLSAISFGPEDEDVDIATRGQVTITYPLTGTATSEQWTSVANFWYYEDFDEDYRTGVQETWYTVLPAVSQGNFKLSVVVGGGDPKTAVVPAEYMRWQPGYEYTYRFKVTEGGNVSLDHVQVGIGNWVIKSNVEHPVYNW